MTIFNDVLSSGIVAIIRGQKQENILSIMEALWKGGVRSVEITADTLGIVGAIEESVKEFGDEMFIGAGTVLDPETAKNVIQSGAQFIVSPTLNIETIRLTKRYGVISMPAAMTPTEILTAYETGADIVKLFPASSLGSDFIKNIRGPLPHIPIMATGGVNLNNMEEFFQVGSSMVGIGNSLVNGNAAITADELNNISVRAEEYVQKFKEIRESGVLSHV